MATKLDDAALHQVATPDFGAGDAVQLDDRYLIFPQNPAPELDIPGAAAFAAQDQDNPGKALIAYLCHPDIHPRMDAIPRIRTIHDSLVAQPVHWGAVSWPGEAGCRFVTVLDRPKGDALIPANVSRVHPMPADEIIRRVLEPAVRTLVQFAQRGLTHRAIRPGNIFPIGGNTSLCRLGDCTATPAGWGQPAAFEPLELIMVEPEFRGAGMLADDIYALGATIVALASGHLPGQGLSREELHRSKIELGSYATLMQGERAPHGLREIARGMLADDIQERWDLEDLAVWLTGAQSRSIKPVRVFRSDRSFSFAGNEYRDRRALSHALGAHWTEASEAIKSGTFRSWLQRGFGDRAQAKALSAILEDTGRRRSTPTGDSILTARICMRLDGSGPLRLKGYSVMPDGLGTGLAVAIRRRDDKAIQLVSDCLSLRLAEEWCEGTERNVNRDFSSRTFIFVSKNLKKSGPGFGIERCLYELNRSLPCMSGLLKGRFVSELHELVPALEEIAKKGKGLDGLIDRHLAAFIGSRIKQSVDPLLAELTTGSLSAKLAMLKMLGMVQEDYGPETAPHLAAWIAQELKELASDYRSRTLREKVTEQLAQVAAGGKLFKLHDHLANRKLKQRDMNGFGLARRRYTDAEIRISRLQSQEFEKTATRMGWRVAASLSGLVAIATIAATVLY